jgi:hypothetical protein
LGIWVIEETKAKQRSKERQIKGGGGNTSYFHVVANQRRRETSIMSMDGPAETAKTPEEIMNVATDYYKKLFKFEPRPNINIDQDFFGAWEKVSGEENGILEEAFSEQEIKKDVFESHPEGAPSPEDLFFLFYQQFWELAKGGLLELFEDFHMDRLDLYRLNFALITIIPEENDARTMDKFRPISPLNCSYKIFTKMLTNRIGLVADRLIASNQTTFINGRYILESVVTVHEVLHEVHRSKQNGFVMKLDYEKCMIRSIDGSCWIFWRREVLGVNGCARSKEFCLGVQ